MLHTAPPHLRLSHSVLARLHRLFAPLAHDRGDMPQAVSGTDHLPSDRLTDMGLPARTQANRRHSGQAGPVPRVDLW